MANLSFLVFIIEFEFNSILCILSERLRKCQRTFSFSRFKKKWNLEFEEANQSINIQAI